MKTEEREYICKEFNKLNDLPWHILDDNGICSCGAKIYDPRDRENHLKTYNPTYENPIDILKVMMERNDIEDFTSAIEKVSISPIYDFIEEFLFVPDALLIVAYDWCLEHKMDELNDE